ncbi:hypothetical protein KUTeg_010845 [Tegillarca granosa]|uniref:Uncharacterized protein n=1 Tax=Tegillarca granosa TaxID=220873 RepID=A0ABQ9F7E1_TEGGR|nr:hypothetical protein KUTeg_010845 [Tegillarca granosa]
MFHLNVPTIGKRLKNVHFCYIGGADKVSNSVGSKGRSPVKDLTSGDQINSFFNPEQTSFTYKSGGADQISNSVGSKGKSQLKDLPSRGLQLNSFFKPEQTVFKYKPVAKSSSLSAPTKQNTIAKPKKNLSGSTKSSGNGNSISNNNSGKRQGNGLTNWSGSRTQSQNTWGTFTTTSRPRFNWRRNNFPRQNGFTGMGGGRSGGGWRNQNLYNSTEAIVVINQLCLHHSSRHLCLPSVF